MKSWKEFDSSLFLGCLAEKLMRKLFSVERLGNYEVVSIMEENTFILNSGWDFTNFGMEIIGFALEGDRSTSILGWRHDDWILLFSLI